MTSHPDTYKYPSYLLELLGKILPLREIIARELLSIDSADQVHESYYAQTALGFIFHCNIF